MTYVNGLWQGAVEPARAGASEALASCPFEWDYLAIAGEEGWEIVAAVSSSAGAENARVLYLRREMPSGE